jgi:hypothetical protein
MFSGFLWKRLIIPLGLVTVIFFVLTFLVPCNGLFTNLATTFLGILITVCYVDYLLKRHDKERWAKTTARIEKRILRFAIVTSHSFRVAFNMDSSIVHGEAIDMENPSSISKEMIRVIRQELLPRVDEAVPGIDQKGWAKLTRQLQPILKWGDQLIAAFGNRIDPELFYLILKIEDEIDGMLNMVVTFSDVIGVPDSELRAKPPRSAVTFKQDMEKGTARDIKQILEDSASLMEWMKKASVS